MSFGTPGPMELLIILGIVLVIFGAGKLPQVGGNLGKAIRNFKSGVSKDDPKDQAKLAEDVKAPEGQAKEKTQA